MKKQILLLMPTLLSFIILSGATMTTAAQPADTQGIKKITDIPQPAWDDLATKTIFFAHQSVGSNIMHGIEDILHEQNSIKLHIINTRDVDSLPESPVFLHGPVGRNMHPDSKIKSFRDQMNNGLGNKVDIAFFKFCFIDFNPETDIEAVFQNYKRVMEQLRIQYPDTTFVHVTAPLTCFAPGLRGWVKRGKNFIKDVINKLNIYDHKSANLFNQLLVNEYSGKEPIFDLARFESTKPDGTRVKQTKDGTEYYELVTEYTTDGGHLNEKGRRIIGEQLLIFLAELAEQHDLILQQNNSAPTR